MLAMCQKPLDHAKQSATDVFETVSKRAIQKTAEATDMTATGLEPRTT